MKILKHGTIPNEPEKEAICCNCNSVLLYTRLDVTPSPYPDDPREEPTIKCPVCGTNTPIYWRKHAWDKIAPTD